MKLGGNTGLVFFRSIGYLYLSSYFISGTELLLKKMFERMNESKDSLPNIQHIILRVRISHKEIITVECDAFRYQGQIAEKVE